MSAIRSVRRHPMTALTSLVTVAVGVPALALPGMVRALEQDPPAIWHGQLWRLVTPLLVQGYGVGQFLFNLLGIVLAGMAAERCFGPGRWLVVYLTAGVAAIVLTSLWFPGATDSGSSAAVAGLIGAILAGMLRSRSLAPWPGLLYGTFFAVYLGVLALGGPLAGAVAGTAVIPAFRLARSYAGRDALRIGVLVVVLLATGAMLVVGDAHGVGLATGLLVASPMRMRRWEPSPRAAERPR